MQEFGQHSCERGISNKETLKRSFNQAIYRLKEYSDFDTTKLWWLNWNSERNGFDPQKGTSVKNSEY